MSRSDFFTHILKNIAFLLFATIAVLGWVFLTARDTLLEGLFLNLFKIKKEE